MSNIDRLITELYEKLVLKKPKEVKERKLSMRQFFINSYVNEGLFREFTPFEMTRGNINEIANLSAQITFQLLTPQRKETVEKHFKNTFNKIQFKNI